MSPTESRSNADGDSDYSRKYRFRFHIKKTLRNMDNALGVTGTGRPWGNNEYNYHLETHNKRFGEMAY